MTKPGHPAPVLVNTMTRKLRSISQFASGSAFTEAQLRWFVFNAESNGLLQAGAIARIGRRVYLDEQGFDRWLQSQNPALRSAAEVGS